jgi:glycosyltransferase involved in cell wall biosynthesis
MNIKRSFAVDTSTLYMGKAGVSRYARSLLSALNAKYSELATFHEIAWKVENFSYRQPMRSIKTAYRELVWTKWVAPSDVRRCEAEALFSPAGYFIPVDKSVGHLVTIHDLAVIDEPSRYRKWHRLSTQARLLKATSADKIICISEFTANRLMHHLKINSSKIEIIYNGGAIDVGSIPGSIPNFRPLPPEYFLFVGSIEPGKNLSLLKSVYEKCRRDKIYLPPLIVAGARWQGVSHEGEPPKEWIFLGRVCDAELYKLYQSALALLFPSKYEGFGLPVIEAMSLGCPVACAPVASLPEVGGKAAIYVPLSPDEWAKTLIDLVKNHKLREEARSLGIEHAKRFTWDRCAKHTYQVLSETKKRGGLKLQHR